MISLAKINWSLRIVGRRTDGYHRIESIFLPIFDLHDQVEFQLRLGSSLQIEATGKFSNSMPVNQDNLMAKALKILGLRLELKIGGIIQINKNIPIASGLGGGSSNAATILILAKNKLQELDIQVSPQVLFEVATEVGADVSFFLDPKPALVQGIGEVITAIQSPAAEKHALLITPQFNISAKDAYQFYQTSEESFTAVGSYNESINDLGSALRKKYIALNIILNQLELFSPTTSFVSGSGPTCVGLFHSKSQAILAKESFSQNFYTTLTKL